MVDDVSVRCEGALKFLCSLLIDLHQCMASKKNLKTIISEDPSPQCLKEIVNRQKCFGNASSTKEC